MNERKSFPMAFVSPFPPEFDLSPRTRLEYIRPLIQLNIFTCKTRISILYFSKIDWENMSWNRIFSSIHPSLKHVMFLKANQIQVLNLVCRFLFIQFSLFLTAIELERRKEDSLVFIEQNIFVRFKHDMTKKCTLMS